MIKDFIAKFHENEEELREVYREKFQLSYIDIVKNTIKSINPDRDYDLPDFKKIKEVDFGDYQGTCVFIVPNCSIYPTAFWASTIQYGSCSHCDTLEGINGHNRQEKPTEEQVEDYMTLSLHIVQNISKIGND